MSIASRIAAAAVWIIAIPPLWLWSKLTRRCH